MVQGYEALTEREKQTLRLLLTGHDAKSIARTLGLSVHTINERLRDARRKLAVSSSKEAARLVRAREGGDPQRLGDTPFGDAAPARPVQPAERPGTEPPTKGRADRAIGGVFMISMFVAALTLFASAQPPQDGTAAPATAAVEQAETPVSGAAHAWLALVDAGRWQESWAATARSFRSLNTVAAWQSASQRARVPLGRVLTRTLLDEHDVPAPPGGVRTVRFRTDFANRRGAVETLSFDREDGAWKVVGIYIE